MTTKYLYEGKKRYEWLDSGTALGKAITDSLANGYRTVPISTEHFCSLVPASPKDGRTVRERALAFASSCGLGYAIENHGTVVRFFA